MDGTPVGSTRCSRRRPKASPTCSPCSATRVRRGCAPRRSSYRIRASRMRHAASARAGWKSPGPPTTRRSRGWWHTSQSMTETPTPAPRRSRAVILALVALIAAAAFSGLAWLDARHRIGVTQEELARRLRDIEADARDARSIARQAQDGLRDSQAKVTALEARLTESQSQQLALEALYQELSRNRDEWQLAEIEQVLAIASQQLQLAGNVRAALLALQLAEQRLARADRPQFVPIRRALARDIDRLKTLPTLDLAGMSLRIDNLAAQVDKLPLAFDERAEPGPPAKDTAAAAGERGFWSRLSTEVWNELRQLVVVRQVGNAEPPLLPPSQAYFVRENL